MGVTEVCHRSKTYVTSPVRNRETLSLILDQILPDIARPSDNRQDLSQMRSPLSHEPAGPSRSSSGRARLSPPPYQSRSSPVSPNQMNDRYQGSSGYGDRRLPVRSGPPPNREHTSLSASGWPDRQPPSSLAPSNSFGVPAPPQHAHHDRYGARTPDYGGHDRNGGSSLPPPPPPFHSSTNSYSQSQSDREHANGSAAYSASPYAGDRYRGSPSNHGPAPSLAHNTTAYGRHSMQPSGYPAHQPNTNGYSAHQPNANGYPYSNGQEAVSYEGADEPAPRRRRGNLPRWVTDYLKAWLLEHIAHPYPTEQEKNQMCSVTGLQMTQVSWM